MGGKVALQVAFGVEVPLDHLGEFTGTQDEDRTHGRILRAELGLCLTLAAPSREKQERLASVPLSMQSR
jgi:hypothetical protein